MAIARQPVIGSHNIKSIGHENGVMHIEFHDGKVYEYTGPLVTAHHDALMKSQSKGGYFMRNVRHCKQTTCTRIALEPKASK